MTAPTRREIEIATAANRDAYDAIHGSNRSGGRAGSETVFKRIKKKYDADPKKYAAEYKAAKAQYDADVAAYAKTQATKNALTKAGAESLAIKDTSTAIKDYNKAINDLTLAEALIPTQGQKQADAAFAAAETARKAAVKAGADIAPMPTAPAGVIRKPIVSDTTPTAVTDTTPYGQYTVNPDGSVFAVGGAQQYILTIPKPNARPGGPSEDVQTPFASLAQARDALIKQYGTGNNLNKLKQQLLASGYATQQQLDDGSWALKSVDDFITAYTTHAVLQVKSGEATNSDTVSQFLLKKKLSTGTGTGAPTQYRVITTRGDAKKQLDNYMNDLVGRSSTQQEQDSYYNILHKAENDAVSTTVNGTTTGSVLQDADRLVLAAQIARQSLRGTDVDMLLKSGKGSRAATDIAALQKYAADYGIELPAAKALEYVAAGVGQADYLAKQEERIRQSAIQLHPTLKDHILAGGTVADIADQYKYAKQSKLGIVIKDSTQDKEIMDAVAKGMTISDYTRAQQQNPLWRQTEEAHNTAADFANTILKSFGFMG